MEGLLYNEFCLLCVVLSIYTVVYKKRATFFYAFANKVPLEASCFHSVCAFVCSCVCPSCVHGL